ncbi:MAG: leucyl/phenylalanyl-tRNA--protein transferase [Bacteroidota bacterium]
MPVYLLSKESIVFPSPELASDEGVLAVGGDLSPERLLLAYQHGIFPWFTEKEPILWWSPDPRFVLFPEDLKVSKSMRPYFNQQKFQITYDQAFEQVMRCCQKPRPGQWGGDTWITEDMVVAYVRLHQLGYAHSVEVWEDDDLMGGLYGVSLGKCFFGESMFTKSSNASKFGFITLVKRLEAEGFNVIDCQQQTRHLASLGAKAISRHEFTQLLELNQQEESLVGNWGELLV